MRAEASPDDRLRWWWVGGFGGASIQSLVEPCSKQTPLSVFTGSSALAPRTATHRMRSVCGNATSKTRISNSRLRFYSEQKMVG